MRAFCFLALITIIGVLMSFAAPGLPAQIKLPPQVKPGGMPPPVVPPPKPPDPKGKPPMPIPGQPGTNPGLPTFPGTGTGTSGAPDKKKDEAQWPKLVNGKSAEVYIKEMRTNPDPAVRESSVRALPAFGPKGRELGGQDLVDVLTKDADWNVKIAALQVMPTVLWGYAKLPDTPLANGLAAIVNLLSSEHLNVRFEAIGATTAIGTYMRLAQPKVISSLTFRSKDGNTWYMRKAAAAALGSVGNSIPTGENPEDKSPPDTGAITALLEMVKFDNCALVRSEAMSSLIGVGPVVANQQKKWRADLEYVIKNDKDKSVVLWTRVCILRNDPAGVEGNKAHFEAVANLLKAPEVGGRLEACNALGALGEEAKAKLQDLLSIIVDAKEDITVIAAAVTAVSNMKSEAKVILPVLQQARVNRGNNEDFRKLIDAAIDFLSGKKKN